MSECLASPAVRNTSKRAHEPLPRELDHEQRDWGAERQGEQWVRFLEGMKGTWILLTALWTLSNNLPMGSWEVLTHQSPQMVQELPQLLLCMKHIRPHPGLVSCLDSQQQGQSKPCLIASECPQKADPNVLAKEWHLGFFFTTFGKMKQRLSALGLVCCKILGRHTSLGILLKRGARGMDQLYL